MTDTVHFDVLAEGQLLDAQGYDPESGCPTLTGSCWQASILGWEMERDADMLHNLDTVRGFDRLGDIDDDQWVDADQAEALAEEHGLDLDETPWEIVGGRKRFVADALVDAMSFDPTATLQLVARSGPEYRPAFRGSRDRDLREQLEALDYADATDRTAVEATAGRKGGLVEKRFEIPEHEARAALERMTHDEFWATMRLLLQRDAAADREHARAGARCGEVLTDQLEFRPELLWALARGAERRQLRAPLYRFKRCTVQPYGPTTMSAGKVRKRVTDRPDLRTWAADPGARRWERHQRVKLRLAQQRVQKLRDAWRAADGSSAQGRQARKAIEDCATEALSALPRARWQFTITAQAPTRDNALERWKASRRAEIIRAAIVRQLWPQLRPDQRQDLLRWHQRQQCTLDARPFKPRELQAIRRGAATRTAAQLRALL